MKRNIYLLIGMVFMASCLVCGDLWGQEREMTREVSRRNVNKVIKAYNYNDWGPGSARITSGVRLSKRILESLGTRFDMTKAWPKENYSISEVNGVSYSIIRQRWKLEEGNELDVTMVVAPTSEAAKRYLLSRYAGSQVVEQFQRPKGRELGIEVGDICFALGKKNSRKLGGVDFIRNNVLVMIKANGSIRMELGDIAAELDGHLLVKENVAGYATLKETPTIARFSSRETTRLGDRIPLKLEINNKKDGRLRYFWKMTGGGVEKDRNGNYYYYAGEPGKHTITLSVLNEMGVQNSQSIDIEVIR